MYAEPLSNQIMSVQIAIPIETIYYQIVYFWLSVCLSTHIEHWNEERDTVEIEQIKPFPKKH